MADAVDKGKEISDGSGKTYGQTVLQDSARAILGDVNIGRDVHVHVYSQFDHIAAAGSVIGLVHIGNTLRNARNHLDKNALTSQTADVLSRALVQLEQTQSQLNIHYSAISPLRSTERQEDHLCQILSDALRDAQGLLKSLKPLRQELESKPEDPREVYKESYKASHRRGEESEYNIWLGRLKFVFFSILGEPDLLSRLEAVSKFHGRVNRHLRALLNPPDHGSIPVESSDISEILSMHQSPNDGLQPLGALLVRKNGLSATMTTQLLKEKGNQPRFDSDMSVIRYNLDSADDDPEPQMQSPIQTVPNVVVAVKAALYFREEGDRLAEVKEAHRRTFGWIYEQSDKPSDHLHFRQWLEKGSECFWINGKAGSGKSTLMKFIYHHRQLSRSLQIWAGRRQLLVASFFFWYAGMPLQRSYQGVLRSLLHQVLEVRPELTTTIFPRLSRYILSGSRSLAEPKLSVTMQELQEAMHFLAGKLPPDLAIVFIVDGVDEYDGDHHDFCDFLVALSKISPVVKIIVSSRPIPACSQAFSTFPGLRLQDLTLVDIQAYINAELLCNQLLIDLDLLEPGRKREIETALIEKASGVFLWIVLVVRSLLKALREYEDWTTLTQIIDALPSDLEDLYDHMFLQMSQKHQQQGSLLLQLTARARDVQVPPLTALQLFIADKCNHHEEDFTEWIKSDPQLDAVRVKTIDGKLRSKCCGLVEVQYRDVRGPHEPKIDFLHKTVYDYIRNPLIWQKVTKIYNIVQADLDLRLLVSVVHFMRSWKHADSREKDMTLPWLLGACLEYSNTMACAGDNRYAGLLRLADQKCLLSCSSTNRVYSRRVYQIAYDKFISKRQYSLPEESEDLAHESTANIPTDWASILIFTRFNFPDYFALKVKKDIKDSGERNLLLKLVLALCVTDGTDAALARAYSRNVHALCKYGAHPNGPVRLFSQGAMLYFPHIVNQRPDLVSHSRSNSSCRQNLEQSWADNIDKSPNHVSTTDTPWRFWLTQNLKTMGHLHITIHMSDAGASLEKGPSGTNSEEETKLSMLEKSLHKRLARYKTHNIWPKELKYAGSQELLPDLQLLPSPARCDKKRLSPAVPADFDVKRQRPSPAALEIDRSDEEETSPGSSRVAPIVINDD